MSFALELALRIRGRDEFNELYMRLQCQAAAYAISFADKIESIELSSDDIRRLLYCASIFAQCEDAEMKSIAQSIALNSLVLNHEDVPTRDSLSLLSDIGNFPAIAYAEDRHSFIHDTFQSHIHRAVSRAINIIKIGDTEIALTEFQKSAWEKLSNHRVVAISAPTSAGKSFLVIEHLCRVALRSASFIGVYVAPTRALLSEIYAKIQHRTQGAQNLRVSTVPTIDAGGYTRQIYVLTQERLQALLAATSISFDMIVVDEAQNISDGARGMILQECLEQAFSRASSTRLILLAPGAESFDEMKRAIGLGSLEPEASKMPSVLQNRILVTPSVQPNHLHLSLLTDNGPNDIGIINARRGFDLPASRLAAVALELGAKGGSLVYATGPADAETVALQLVHGRAQEEDPDLTALSEFIQKHIHKDYKLAKFVRYGVAFHYGKMPTLLREAIENAFKAGSIKYLVCTTTLFQGINLPARNVFIDTPKRGKGSFLDPAALWNFAGRAGRMKSDIIGNVFLVGYADWTDKPMDKFVAFRIEPSFAKTVSNAPSVVLKALEDKLPSSAGRDELTKNAKAAAGLMIAHAARDSISSFMDRSLPLVLEVDRARLSESSKAAASTISLPASFLSTNWTINPFGLRRLYDDLILKIKSDALSSLVPVNPHGNAKAKDIYASIFMRIQKAVNGSGSAFHAVVAGIAVDWMEGKPYPAMLASAIRREGARHLKKVAAWEREVAANPATRKRKPKPPNVSDVIRREFELIEDQVRFLYVQLGKAYVELLVLALRETGHGDKVGAVFNFPLALELGVATRSGWSFMELGLSRIAASALEPFFPDSNLEVSEARDWLRTLDISALQLNSVIVDELMRLGLVRPTALSA